MYIEAQKKKPEKYATEEKQAQEVCRCLENDDGSRVGEDKFFSSALLDAEVWEENGQTYVLHAFSAIGQK